MVSSWRSDIQLHGLLEQLRDFLLELRRPDGILELGWLIRSMPGFANFYGLVAPGCLVLLGGARHLVLAAQGRICVKPRRRTDLPSGRRKRSATSAESGRSQAILRWWKVRVLIASMKGIRNSSLLADGLDFVVGVEDFRFIQASDSTYVLVGVECGWLPRKPGAAAGTGGTRAP